VQLLIFYYKVSRVKGFFFTLRHSLCRDSLSDLNYVNLEEEFCKHTILSPYCILQVLMSACVEVC